MRSVLSLFFVREFRDLRRNRQLWPAYVVLPLLALALHVFLAAALPELLLSEKAKRDPTIRMMTQTVERSVEFSGMPPAEAFARYFLRNLAGLFLIMPVILSAMGAAYAIVGEKQQRTLEPILATPITDIQFLFAKFLGSILPPLLVTWAAALGTAAVVAALTWGRYAAPLLPDRFWLVAVFVLGPLMGAGAVLAAMRLSARMVDPQAANQVTALLIVPLFLISMAVFGKILTLYFSALCIACGMLLLLDAWLFRVNVRRFQREEILTRWTA